uniref:Uncharacterized protein n=1 Tax=Populus alba TaxID=43335 RepID=A0A4U5P1Q3_POPAL|nr:hypothetical protein D5086_0000238670 [Populus alba]
MLQAKYSPFVEFQYDSTPASKTAASAEHRCTNNTQLNDCSKRQKSTDATAAAITHQAKQQLPAQMQTHQIPQRQQMNDAPSYPISSPQLPQLLPLNYNIHLLRFDQQNLPSSVTKTGTPLQSANDRLLVVPSPSLFSSILLCQRSEKPVSGISSLLSTGKYCYTNHLCQAPAPIPLQLGTPGISASPLLAEFTSPDGAHGSALDNCFSGKSTNVTSNHL